MKYCITIWVLSVLFVCCTTRPVTPSSKSRRIIDSTFQKQVADIQAAFDIRCKVYADSVYQAAVDSMLHERQLEINQLVK